jgi:hypothetical protein
LGLGILLVSIPAYVQIDDLNSRYKISDRVSKVKDLGMFTQPNFNALLQDLNEIDDAGYRYRMALNFYSISECEYGDLVYEIMVKTNPMEARLRELAVIKNACVEA